VAALEYRLQVVNLYEEAFAYYLGSGSGTVDGSLRRLESAAARGEIPAGAMLYDRPLTWAEPSLARALRAATVRPEAVEGVQQNWTEFRWEGEPGKRVVWLVDPRSHAYQELRHVGLKGTGTLRHFIPYNAAMSVERLPVVGFPTNFILSYRGRESLWDRWVSRYLDLGEGIAALVGVDTNPVVPDTVFLIIEQPPAPTVFKAALAWRMRPGTHESQFEGQGWQ